MLQRPHRQDVYADDFEDMCGALATAVSEYRPDVVVGIETGGARVAELMLPHLLDATLVAVRLQRPATKWKSRIRLDRLTGILPPVLTDALRWLEVEGRELWFRLPGPVASVSPAMTAAARHLEPALVGARRVLVVDDTIDSGRTLSTIEQAARTAAPTAEVRTAVLTSTWRRPPIRPDFCLYHRTLLRLPWSFDAAVR